MLNPITKQIINLFESKGGSMYGGEAVSQLEHALQAADLAKKNQASDGLIAASILHDVGHLLHDLPEMASEDGIDDIHEELAARFLKDYFVESVTEPVKLHVQAKRYLCAVEPGYYESLSQPSKTSLALQGGIMVDQEIEDFQKNPYYKDAVSLRKWDDLAKVPNLDCPDLREYIVSIEKSLK
ncbi:MAG: HD domain-containing protein [Bacteroidota bacterium]|nr:HD domain-containing protein [Daejeonella sp.]MDP3143828.1 HD domain-containing protein [Bacteroidota bacterium]